jgi:hypothetical protein
MGLTEEIQQLKEQGTSDEIIEPVLLRKGYSKAEIGKALAASTIKGAVTAPGIDELQPSLGSSTESVQEETSPPAPYQGYPSSEQVYAEQYPSDQYASSGVSAETMAEVAEQAVEALLVKRDTTLAELASFKAQGEAQLRTLEERIKRIEGLLDKMQLAILQKVGDQLTNLEDIKREVIETQKTFKALAPQRASEKRTRPTPQENV